MKKLTREWVTKAEADHDVAVQVRQSQKPHHDHVCFLCQQCSEKYLKALLEERGMSIPKTHDLGLLLTLLKPHYPTLGALSRGLNFLSDFAVDVRYPGASAKKRQAVAALRWMEKVRTVVRDLLGIRPQPKNRKKSP